MFQNLIEMYQPILRRVQEHIPNAVLAGGCLRDTFYGVEVKDLDFVVESVNGMYPVMPIPTTPWLRQIWPDKEWTWPALEALEFYGQQDNPNGLMDVVKSTDDTVNFIIVRNIKQYTNHFPDSISEMVFDGEQVHVSQRWEIGNNMREIYYNPTIQANRLEKLRRKYPDPWVFRAAAAQQPQQVLPLEW